MPSESFALPNEREGSAIGRQVVQAMIDERVKVLFVGHRLDLAHRFCRHGVVAAVFPCPPRASDGHRSFELAESEPLPTSYAEDFCRRVFGWLLHLQASAVPEARR